MRKLHQVAASQLGVKVWYQKASILEWYKNLFLSIYYKKWLNSCGIYFFAPDYWERSEALGSQCGHCDTIVWITGRNDPILFEEYPAHLPSTGPLYKAYLQDNLKRFFYSLPPCPNCHQQNYDLLINNVVTPRSQSKKIYLSKMEKNSYEDTLAQLKDTPVWWYGDNAEVQRLNLQLLELDK